MKFRRATPFATSVALHVLIGGAFLQWYYIGYVMPDLAAKDAAPAPERIKFVTLTHGGSATGTARTAGGGKASKPAEEKQLVAPVEAAATIEQPAPAKPESGGDNGTEKGSGTGALGAMEGMRPMLGDARVYTVPRGLSGPDPKTHKELIDSSFKDKFSRYRDSTMAVAAAHADDREPGDWTVKDGSGRKWGIDPQLIHLGKFSLPTVLLALLPMNLHTQRNGPEYYENRRIAAMTEEIKYQAVHSQNAEDFSSAVKRIRERKDRERSEQLKRRREPPSDVLPSTFPVATP